MIRYTKLSTFEKVWKNVENTRKNEVILTYAKKNKSAHDLPRQNLKICPRLPYFRQDSVINI